MGSWSVPSFLLQFGDSGMMSAGSVPMMYLPEKIAVIGVFVQVLFFGFIAAVVSHIYVLVRPSLSSYSESPIGRD